jgi:YNFM family putative membrane transporter
MAASSDRGSADRASPAWPLLLISVLALAALYAPQPILPRWAAAYSLPETQVALVIAVALVPLGVAPLAAGVLLRRVATTHLLRGATAVLAVAVGGTALRPPFVLLLGLRVVQGTAIAALLTALMTHIAHTREGAPMQRLMAAYVAATILGGFLGRLVAGVTASVASDAHFFVGLAVLLALSDWGLQRLPVGPPSPTTARASQTRLRSILTRGPIVRIYALVFCLFFVFSAFMNFLPFRLRAVHPSASDALAGGLYVGYLVGMATALGARRMTEALPRPRTSMALGGGGVLVALAVAQGPSVPMLFGAVAVLCGTFFLAHAVAAGHVNTLGPRGADGPGRSLVNGLYVAVYYTGGVLGAYLPGFVYDAYGWTPFLGTLALVTVAGVAALFVPIRRRISG